jgi:hypothetical protein
MLILLVLLALVYWFFKLRKRPSAFVDVSSANALDPDEVQLMVTQVPRNLTKLTIFGDVGCEYDVFVKGLSVIPHPVTGGTTTLARWYPTPNISEDELMVVQKKNITMERMIVPSVVRFHQ